MDPVLPGLPDGVVTVDDVDKTVAVTVDETVYPLDAVYGAAYPFIDRCYVLVDRPAAGRLRVTLAPKQGELVARPLAGDLLAELLTAAWRRHIAIEQRPQIEAVTRAALAGALNPTLPTTEGPKNDPLAKYDFSEEAFEDPLGIAVAWEEKYKKPGEGEGGGKP